LTSIIRSTSAYCIKPSVGYSHGSSSNSFGFHISSGMEFWLQGLGGIFLISVTRESIHRGDIFCRSLFCWFALANIATSVIMSVTGAAPFNGASDQGLGVAYISVFLLVFLLHPCSHSPLISHGLPACRCMALMIVLPLHRVDIWLQLCKHMLLFCIFAHLLISK
jgi:hypothetical protein